MRRDGVQVLSPRGDFHADVRRPPTIRPRSARSTTSCSASRPTTTRARVPWSGRCSGTRRASSPPRTASRGGTSTGSPVRYAGRRIEAVDPGGAVSAVLDPVRAIGCVVYSLDGASRRPGVVRHVEGTRFTIGEPDGSDSAPLPRLLGGDGGGRPQVPGRVRHPHRRVAEADGQCGVQPDQRPCPRDDGPDRDLPAHPARSPSTS